MGRHPKAPSSSFTASVTGSNPGIHEGIGGRGREDGLRKGPAKAWWTVVSDGHYLKEYLPRPPLPDPIADLRHCSGVDSPRVDSPHVYPCPSKRPQTGVQRRDHAKSLRPLTIPILGYQLVSVMADKLICISRRIASRDFYDLNSLLAAGVNIHTAWSLYVEHHQNPEREYGRRPHPSDIRAEQPRPKTTPPTHPTKY